MNDNLVTELQSTVLITIKALSLILDDKQGIILDVDENMKFPENVKKIVLFNHENTIKMSRCDEDIPNGSIVEINENTHK